jgi:hypothetical protein
VIEPASDPNYRVMMAVDAGTELAGLIGVVPMPPPKPPLRFILRRPGAWAAFVLHRGAEPDADLVRRICNQADVYGDAANDLGIELADTPLVNAAAALKEGASLLWSKQIDVSMFRGRSSEVSDLVAPHLRRAQVGEFRLKSE